MNLWRDVTRELPTHEQPVLIVVKVMATGTRSVRIGQRRNGEWLGMGARSTGKVVTHWMPMLDLPHERSEFEDEFPMRAITVFRAMGIDSFDKLAHCTSRHLLLQPGFSKGSLARVKAIMAAHGYQLDERDAA